MRAKLNSRAEFEALQQKYAAIAERFWFVAVTVAFPVGL